MKRVIIVGAGMFAALMKTYLEEDGNREVAAFSVENQYIELQYFCGLPVIPLEEIEKSHPPESYDLLLAIGYKKMHKIREHLFQIGKKKCYHIITFIHSSAIISPSVPIGEGNIILEGVIIEAQTVIGNGNLLFGGSFIAHNCSIGDFNTFSIKSALAGCCTIKHHCFIGANATIKDSITVPEYTLIGAGTYVGNSHLKPYDVVSAPKSITLENKKSTDIF